MIAGLRRVRLIALLLVGGTPGLGGVVLQAVHPCPAEMPWLPGATGEHAHHAGDEGATPDRSDAEGCHCIGSCSVSAAPAVGTSILETVGANLLRLEPHRDQRAGVPTLLPIERFPPKTAPPSLG